MSYDNCIFVFNAKDSIGGFWKRGYVKEFDDIFAKEIINLEVKVEESEKAKIEESKIISEPTRSPIPVLIPNQKIKKISKN